MVEKSRTWRQQEYVISLLDKEDSSDELLARRRTKNDGGRIVAGRKEIVRLSNHDNHSIDLTLFTSIYCFYILSIFVAHKYCN